MLHWVVERARAIRRADDVIVVVPDGDDRAADCARAYSVSVYWGSPVKLADGRNDVLHRYVTAARAYGLQESDLIVRITSDCPLHDPEGADLVIARAVAGAAFCDNTRPGVDGLDTEAFRFSLLLEAHERATDPDDRHHVTPWLRRQEGRVHVSYYEHYEPKIALSVNTREDYDRVYAIARQLMLDGRRPVPMAFPNTLIAARKAGVFHD